MREVLVSSLVALFSLIFNENPIEYVKEYFAGRHNLDEFAERVDSQMAAYEECEAKKREELLAKSNEPDEDGFMTVVSKKPKVFDTTDSTNLAGNEKTTAGIKLMPNFYKYSGKGQRSQRIFQPFISFINALRVGRFTEKV